jgi:adenylate cyclase
MERRLAAIVAADVVGYSRMVRADEEGTLERLKSLRAEIIDPSIAKHNGRIVKLMGDGMLAEFGSVVDAVRNAVEVQNAVAAHQAGLPEDRRIVFRVGINLGDVVIDEDDIYGDGVNIASRLEGLAEPGGICVSGKVYEEVCDRTDFTFEDMGEQQVKNVDRPVRVWRLLLHGDASMSHAPSTARPHPLPNKPSIAVLPFNNMSNDPDQEYFADGLTEDLITELSRFQSLAVIARNSSFTYKGRAVRVQDVGKELGVQYVVEGSVRKLGPRLRVTVQLVEATTGTHLWADRYDRDLEQIFELHDELTRAIVATASGRLEDAVFEKIKSKPPRDLNAYDCVMRAKLLHHRGEPEDNEEALQLLETAMELAPGYAAAYGWKVCVLSQAWTRGYREIQDGDYDYVVDLIKKGFAEDENDLECVRILGEYYIETKQFDEARRFNDKALRLNPNDPRLLAQRGELLTWIGEPKEALTWLQQATDLDPFSADDWAHLVGRAYFGEKRYEEAQQAFRRAPRLQIAHRAYLAACYGYITRPDDALAQVQAIFAADPNFSASKFAEGLFYKNPEDVEHVLTGLKKAGLVDA